ncbi:MAG: PaaI family thioesterase [Thermodesulfovibrionales bacterium]|nr:PaaI family thioesterase [Thermodesulfovibrionales bacterium]
MLKNLKLEDDGYCFACGKKNPYGLKLSFIKSNSKVLSEFTPSDIHQGYKGVAHGGIISTLLDEAMIHAAVFEGFSPVTAELTIRFKQPLMIGETAIVEAEVVKYNPKLILTKAKLLRKTDQTVIAEANGKIAIKPVNGVLR